MTNYIYRFKITFQQQLIILIPMLFTNLVLVVGEILIFKFNINVFSIVYAIFFFIDMLPTIILHTQYLLKNNGVILTLNTETKELVYEKNTELLKYSFDDIVSLQYYRSLGKGSGWHSFGQYRYYKITFNDNRAIFITCLLINDIENTLEILLRIESEKHPKILCLLE